MEEDVKKICLCINDATDRDKWRHAAEEWSGRPHLTGKKTLPLRKNREVEEKDLVS